MTLHRLFPRAVLAGLAALALAACNPETTGSASAVAGKAPAGGLFAAPLEGPTPARGAGFAVDQGKAKGMVEMGDAAAFDVRPGMTAPGAVNVAWLAAPLGSASEEAALRRRALAEYDGLRRTPIVVVGAGASDRGAWNAATRLRRAGFANVIWRREAGL